MVRHALSSLPYGSVIPVTPRAVACSNRIPARRSWRNARSGRERVEVRTCDRRAQHARGVREVRQDSARRPLGGDNARGRHRRVAGHQSCGLRWCGRTNTYFRRRRSSSMWGKLRRSFRRRSDSTGRSARRRSPFRRSRRTVTRRLAPNACSRERYKSGWSRATINRPCAGVPVGGVFGPRLGIAISSPVRPDFTLIGQWERVKDFPPRHALLRFGYPRCVRIVRR